MKIYVLNNFESILTIFTTFVWIYVDTAKIFKAMKFCT